MKILSKLGLAIPLSLVIFIGSIQNTIGQTDTLNHKFLTYIVDPKAHPIKLFWKSDNGEIFGSLGNFKKQVEQEGHQLIFATNGGMYREDRSPVGLFIQNGKTISRLVQATGTGNFYLKPNGVFYITKNHVAAVCTSENFISNPQIQFATQSGPMLVIDGKIHPSFVKGSANVNIRSGVGILPDGKVIFALSKDPVNFYDFAACFKQLGCLNALFLDGFVSRTYLPEKNWLQTDGDFGVIIGVLSN